MKSKIEAGKIREGEGKKGHWENVSFLVDGKWASTFDKKFVDGWNNSTIREGDEVEYEMEQNDKGFWNFTKLELPGASLKTADEVYKEDKAAALKVTKATSLDGVKQPKERENEERGLDVQGEIDHLWSIAMRFMHNNESNMSKFSSEDVQKLAVTVYLSEKRRS